MTATIDTRPSVTRSTSSRRRIPKDSKDKREEASKPPPALQRAASSRTAASSQTTDKREIRRGGLQRGISVSALVQRSNSHRPRNQWFPDTPEPKPQSKADSLKRSVSFNFGESWRISNDVSNAPVKKTPSSRQIPSPSSSFSSGHQKHSETLLTSMHVLINRHRQLNGLEPIKRCPFMDTLARLHARKMARISDVCPSFDTLGELRKKLKSECASEYVKKGTSIRVMFEEALSERSDNWSNVTGNFTEWGVSTARNGEEIYMCLLFR